MSYLRDLANLAEMNAWYFGLQVVVVGVVQAAIWQGKKSFLILQIFLPIVSMLIATLIYTFALSESGSVNPLEAPNFKPWAFYGINAAAGAVLSFAVRPLLRNAVKAAPDKTGDDSKKPRSGS